MKFSLTLALLFALLLISHAEEQKKRRKDGKKTGKKFVLFDSESEGEQIDSVTYLRQPEANATDSNYESKLKAQCI